MKYDTHYFKLCIDSINYNKIARISNIDIHYLPLPSDSLNKIAYLQGIKLDQKTLLTHQITFTSFNLAMWQRVIDQVDSTISLLITQQKQQSPTIKKKRDQIKFENDQEPFQIEILNVDLHGGTFTLQMIDFNLKIQQKQFKCTLNRLLVLDLIEKSKFKYIMDQNSIDDYEEACEPLNSQIFQPNEDPFMEVEGEFDTNSLILHVNIEPIRVCLSGHFLEYLLALNENYAEVIMEDYSEQDAFQVIDTKPEFNLQVHINPIIVIVTFDSSGIRFNGILKGLMRLGSINNLLLASEELQFYAYDQEAWHLFAKALLQKFGSTLQLTQKIYSSLEIMGAFNQLASGFHNLLVKPIKHGLVLQGMRDFACGFMGSVLKIAQIPNDLANAVAEVMGVGMMTKPLMMLNGVWRGLYEKVSLDEEIPKRFLK